MYTSTNKDGHLKLVALIGNLKNLDEYLTWSTYWSHETQRMFLRIIEYFEWFLLEFCKLSNFVSEFCEFEPTCTNFNKKFVMWTWFRNNQDNVKLGEEDEAKVRALLKYHPQYTEKMGCGIEHIKVNKKKAWTR